MNQRLSANHTQPFSMVKDIVEREETNGPALLSAVFGRGLRTLIRYRCAEHGEDCFFAVIVAVYAAIIAGFIRDDAELPASVHAAFRRISEGYPRSGQENIGEPLSSGVIDQLHQHLLIFTDVQREALRRYMCGESPKLICAELQVEPGQFNFIRRVAIRAADMTVRPAALEFNNCSASEDEVAFPAAAAH